MAGPWEKYQKPEQAQPDGPWKKYQARDEASNSTLADIKHGAVPWAYQAGENLRSAFGSLGDLALAGVEKLGKGVKVPTEMPQGEAGRNPANPPKFGSVDLGEAAHSMRDINQENTAAARIQQGAQRHPSWDLTYQPQTFGGHATQNLMNIAPQAAFGGVPGLVKGGMAALGSAGAGKLAHDYLPSWAQAPAEMIGGALGWGGAQNAGKLRPTISAQRGNAVNTLENAQPPVPVSAAQKLGGSPRASWVEVPSGEKPAIPDMTMSMMNRLGIRPQGDASALTAANDKVNQLKFQLNQQTPKTSAYKRIENQLDEATAFRDAAAGGSGTKVPYGDVHNRLPPSDRPGSLKELTGAATEVFDKTPAAKAPIPGGASILGATTAAGIGTAGALDQGLIHGLTLGAEAAPGGIFGLPYAAQLAGQPLRALMRTNKVQNALKGAIGTGESAWMPPEQRSMYFDPALTATALGLKNAGQP